MQQVGVDFGAHILFLPDVVIAAEAMKKATAILEPEMARRGSERIVAGRVVLGTVKGDIHEIGKSLVGTCFPPTASRCTTWAWTCPSRSLRKKPARSTLISWGFQPCHHHHDRAAERDRSPG